MYIEIVYPMSQSNRKTDAFGKWQRWKKLMRVTYLPLLLFFYFLFLENNTHCFRPFGFRILQIRFLTVLRWNLFDLFIIYPWFELFLILLGTLISRGNISFESVETWITGRDLINIKWIVVGKITKEKKKYKFNGLVFLFENIECYSWVIILINLLESYW